MKTTTQSWSLPRRDWPRSINSMVSGLTFRSYVFAGSNSATPRAARMSSGWNGMGSDWAARKLWPNLSMFAVEDVGHLALLDPEPEFLIVGANIDELRTRHVRFQAEVARLLAGNLAAQTDNLLFGSTIDIDRDRLQALHLAGIVVHIGDQSRGISGRSAGLPTLRAVSRCMNPKKELQPTETSRVLEANPISSPCAVIRRIIIASHASRAWMGLNPSREPGTRHPGRQPVPLP